MSGVSSDVRGLGGAMGVSLVGSDVRGYRRQRLPVAWEGQWVCL